MILLHVVGGVGGVGSIPGDIGKGQLVAGEGGHSRVLRDVACKEDTLDYMVLEDDRQRVVVILRKVCILDSLVGWSEKGHL